MTVGVAGCGHMGRPMAEALQAAGFPTRGFDIRPPREFGAFAAAMTDDPDAFADGLTTVLTVVRDIPQTEDVLFGAQGLVGRAPHLRTIIISSTLSPAYVRALRDRVPEGIALVDAPMSGAPVAAEERRLSFMLGGAADDIDPLMPLFRAMGRDIHHLGPFGAGMTAKVLNNLIAASSTAATRLALDWGARMGMDARALRDVFATSSGQTWFGSNFDRISWAREGFDASNTMGILKKDVESLLDAAPEDGRALPLAVIAALSGLDPID